MRHAVLRPLLRKVPEMTGFNHALLGLLDYSRLDERCSLYSLIDGAQFAALRGWKLPADGTVQIYSLLGESAAHDAMYAGPLLFRHARREHCPMLRKLLEVEGNADFMSLVVSRHPAELLRRHLTWLTDVVHDDGTEWVMRYYDARVLPHWLDVLDAEQKRAALDGIVQWVYVDADGQGRSITGSGPRNDQQQSLAPMAMREEQAATLMEKAMPYMVMAELQGDDAHALDALPVHQRYGFFSRQIAKAGTYQLEAVSDVKIYCWLALMYGAQFDEIPAIAATLKPTAKQSTFSERILAWTPQQWAALH